MSALSFIGGLIVGYGTATAIHRIRRWLRSPNTFELPEQWHLD